MTTKIKCGEVIAGYTHKGVKMATLYKMNCQAVPLGVALDGKAIEFLNDFVLDFRQTYYYMDKDMLDEAILGWKETGEQPPQELVDSLYKQLKESGDGISLLIEEG